MNTSANSISPKERIAWKLLGYALFAITSGIIIASGLTYLSSLNAYLAALYIFSAIVLLAISDLSSSQAFSQFDIGRKKTGAFLIAVSLAVSVGVVFLHWNFVSSSMSGVVQQDSVDKTVGQDQRNARIAELQTERSVLSSKIEAPDFGSKSIEQAIILVGENARNAVRQGSTTNGLKISAEIAVLQDKLATAKEREFTFILQEQKRRDLRITEINNEIGKLNETTLSTARSGAEVKNLSDESISLIAIFFAVVLKASGLACGMMSSRAITLVHQGASESSLVAAPVTATAPAVDHPPVVREVPSPEPRQAACTAPVKRDDRLQDLLVAQLGDSDESSSDDGEDTDDATAIFATSLVEANQYETTLSADYLITCVPGCEAFYRALLSHMKQHPKHERLPRKGIEDLIGVGLKGERIGEVFSHAMEVGLLKKEGRSFYLTNLIDDVVI